MRNSSLFKALVLLALVATKGAGAAFACPQATALPDFNCDQSMKIAVTGDSIVRGIGDTQNFTEESGGYVALLNQMMPDAEVANIGVPGASSRRLFRLFKRNAPRGAKTAELLAGVDYLVIEVGTNDYWERRAPAAVPRNITRLRDYLTGYYHGRGEIVPMFIVATLPPTKRGFQQPFIDSVNKQLLTPSIASKLNVTVRFDTLKSDDLISEDKLHPNSDGYLIMAKRLHSVLFRKVRKLAKKQRSDGDSDGLYDQIEKEKFGTDPLLADSDGDGYSDGAELFTYGTDPLNLNSFPEEQQQ